MRRKNNEFKLPKILRKYETADFSTQLKARFLLYLYSLIIVSNVIVTITSIYIQILSSNNSTPNFLIIYPQFVLLLFFIICFILFIKGYYEFSAHLILVSAFACVWLVMFLDDGNTITKLDTVSYIIALLSSIQFFISKQRKTILIYAIVNVLILVFFSLVQKHIYNLSTEMVLDYIIDTGIAMIFIGAIGYGLHNINKKTLDKALDEIEERKVAELELQRSKDQFQSLVSNIPGITFRSIFDSDFTMIYVSSEIQNISGYPSSDFIYNNKRTFESIIYEEDKSNVFSIISSAIDSNTAWEIEYRIIHSDGSIVWVYEKGRPTIFEGKTRKYLDGVIIDITKKKLAEQELELYKNKLEQLVKERTEELDTSLEELHTTNEELFSQKEELIETIEKLNETQDQLIQAEKMASLGVLSAGIAHEINNPLNFIHGGIIAIDDYVNDNCPDSKHSNYIKPLIQIINTGVQRATEIVSSLNHYSRTDDSILHTCNIHSIIDHCLVMLQGNLKNKVEIIKHYNIENYNIDGNEGKLHQVFLNIISNAEHAIVNKGSIEINTSTKDDYLQIDIIDTGEGISQENLSKIFDPFFTTKAPGKGTGLGLSIVHKIINDHNGNISYVSELQKGTKVTISFPLKK